MDYRKHLIQGMLIGAAIFAVGTLFGMTITPFLSHYPLIPAATQLPTTTLQAPTFTPATMTPELTPTTTPEGPFAYLSYTPTPISPASLRKQPLQPGSAHIYGHILCKNAPAKSVSYYLIIIEQGRYAILRAGYTYTTGYWYAENVGPGTYTLMYASPREYQGELVGTWNVEPDQVVDFGEITVDWPICE